MDNFNLTSYYRKQYLIEAEGEEDIPSMGENIASLLPDSYPIKDFAVAVGEVLGSEYGSHNYEEFMKTLHAGLGMNTNNVSPDTEDMFDYQDRVMDMGINKSINEEETKLDTYKLTLTLSDPDEGGPGDWVEEEVKIDSSLGGDEVKTAIKNALMDSGYSRREIYKIEDIKKIN
tara:strand:- start:296 stop:817 length:522 start_codon:yes stop_codon:yes gene_type:complete